MSSYSKTLSNAFDISCLLQEIIKIGIFSTTEVCFGSITTGVTISFKLWIVGCSFKRTFC